MDKLLRSAALGIAFAAVAFVSLAQQPAPPAVTTPGQPAGAPPNTPVAPPIPPTWAQGRSAEQEALNLAPHPPGMTALPENEIPLKTLKVPKGFEVTLWASGMPNARSMVFGPKGTLFVGTRFPGNVYAVVDKGGKREVKTIGKGLYRSNGVAFKNGALYVAELSRIIRYDNIEDNLENPPQPVVVFDALPKDEPHGWKFMTLGPDGWLYFQIGSPGNIVMPPSTHASIMRLDPERKVMENVGLGVRNSVGMDFHPVTKQLWFTNNGRDWVNDDLPNDTLHRVTAKGQHFGFPYATRATCSTRNSARAARARSSRRPRRSWDPTWPRSACASIPGALSPPSTRTISSSPSTARGTAPRRPDTTCRARWSTARARWSRSSPS